MSSGIDSGLISRVEAFMRGGIGYERAASIVGVPRSTAYRWLRSGRADLAEGAGDTPEAELALMVDRVRATVIATSEKTVHQAAREGDVHAAKWVLAKLLPDEYGDRVEVIARTEESFRDVVTRALPDLRQELSADDYRTVIRVLLGHCAEGGAGEDRGDEDHGPHPLH